MSKPPKRLPERMPEELAREFRAWATDPARTGDELYTVELIFEHTRSSWRSRREDYAHEPYEEKEARIEQRAINPAWRPQFTPADFETAEEGWGDVAHLWVWSAARGEDRPVRDLQAIRFFPRLREVTFQTAEIRDLSPLLTLPDLTKLSLCELRLRATPGLGSLEPLGRLAKLEDLSLTIRAAWPDLSPLGRLPALHTLSYRGNPLALASIGALPAVTKASLDADFHWKTPLRSLCDLPEMPRVENLTLAETDDLAGIERFPQLRNVTLEGPYRSLEPLAALTRATFLTLKGELFRTVAPLARIPALQQVTFVREEPLVLDALTDSPTLREVRYERCAIMQTEVAALNAALTPWADDFLLTDPPPAPPVRFITYHPQNPEVDEYEKVRSRNDEMPPPELQGDPALCARWYEWRTAEAVRRLDALLGRGWRGRESGHHHHFRRIQDVMRMREIVAMLSEFLCQCRWPSGLMLNFEPHGDIAEDMDALAGRHLEEGEERDWLDRPFDLEAERQDREDFNERRRREYLRRAHEHRLRLLEEQGLPVDPADFPVEPRLPREKATAGDVPETPEAFQEEDEEEDGGELAIPPPPEDEISEFVEDLSFVVALRPGILWVTEHMREDAEYHWGEPAENWHALPGPLADRPSPH
ncbi:MAG: hypothetical protein WCF18_03210 [Chthoniobacteraceae bacterium]